MYRLGERALVATADFITPVCDDPLRFGKVAAANSLSDVYAMGGRVLFALNLCCFPDDGAPEGVLEAILRGGVEKLAEGGGVLLGGHSVADPELKYGLSVIGEVDPKELMTNANAEPGQRLLLTKPLGTGVLINAFKVDRLDAEGLEPALVQMERLNAEASRLAVEHGVRSATDITGFGFTGHALALARGSGVGIRIEFDALPVYESFYRLVEKGITTGCTRANEANVEEALVDRAGLDEPRRELLADPQTSGGLLLAAPPERSTALLAALRDSGHEVAEIGEVLEGPPHIEIV